jgi:FtsP/CotA-like multicopper oxidase with cupredoxin domain
VRRWTPSLASSFVQIVGDQGLLAQPVGHDHLKIAQAERFDVIIDFSRYGVGEQITLTNRRRRDGTAKVMRFVVARAGTDDSQLPSTWRRSRSTPSAGTTPAPTTTAGRTPSTSTTATTPNSWFTSTASRAGTCPTATTWNTRT